MRKARVLATALLLLLPTAFAALPTSAAGNAGATGWGATVPVSEAPIFGAYRFAMDPEGNAMALWNVVEGQTLHLLARYSIPGVGWLPSIQLDTNASGNGYPPVLGMDEQGNAIALWYEQDPASGALNLTTARFWKGWGWSAAETLGPVDPTGIFSTLAVGAGGEAVAVWGSSDAAGSHLRVATFSPNSSWTRAPDLERGPGFSPGVPAVAVDRNGTALVAWSEPQGVDRRAYYSERGPAGWSAKAPVSPQSVDSAVDQIIFFAEGEAALTWDEYSAGVWTGSWMATYSTAGGWGNATPLPSEGVRGRIVADSAGGLWRLWTAAAAGHNSLWSSQWANGTGWTAPALLEQNDSEVGWSFSLACTGPSSCTAVWEQDEGPATAIWGSSLAGPRAWAAPTLIDSVSPLSAFATKVASGRKGLSVAVWEREGTSGPTLWAARLLEPDTTAPDLVVTSPVNGTLTNVSPVEVVGQTDPGAHVSVAGLLVAPNETGGFRSFVPLTAGLNSIEVRAWDDAGNAATVTRALTFTDPLGKLRDDLDADREASANDTKRLEDRLNGTTELLARAEARYDTLTTTLGKTSKELNDTRDALNASEARVTALSDLLNSTRATVQYRESDFDFLRAQANNTSTQAADAAAQAAAASALLAAREAAIREAAASASTASMLAVGGLVAGAAGVASALIVGRRGGGGGGGSGGTRMSDRPAQQAQGAGPAGKGRPEPHGPSPPPHGG